MSKENQSSTTQTGIVYCLSLLIYARDVPLFLLFYGLLKRSEDLFRGRRK